MAGVTRGRLRVYLGAAPGVGKTYKMLEEGQRRSSRGTDVVVGYVEDHGRPRTAELVAGLEVLPRLALTHRGATFTEMDLDAILKRAPDVVLVDEYAHTNVPGTRHEKRWQDVDEILAAGIDVITTVNIQHLESLNDTVAAITGTRQRETVPDEAVRRADQIELVDMAPEALRRRMAHGNVYRPEKVDAALANYFRVGNLAALRELALLWVADRVDEGLDQYRSTHGIDSTWPARERIVVALTGGPEGEALVRRGARIAGRGGGRDLIAVHVAKSDGLTGADPEALAAQRSLVESLGGAFHVVAGDDVAQSLLTFARGANATQLVVGVSRRSRWQSALTRGVGDEVVRDSGDIDVHLVTHEAAGGGARPPRSRALPLRRVQAGWALALLGPVALTGGLLLMGDRLSLTSDLLLFLTLAVVVAVVGGLWPSLAAAVIGSLCANWFFTPPVRTWTIGEPENALALGLFVVVAALVAAFVHLAARREEEAAQAQSEAAILSSLASSVLGGDDSLPSVLQRMRATFALDWIGLVRVADERGPSADDTVIAAAGERQPGAEVQTLPVEGTDTVLKLSGPTRDATLERVLRAYVGRIVSLLERERLSLVEREADRLAESDAVRTALLAAVSHDLRSPLAAVKAAVSSLRQNDVEWSAHDEAALLETIETSADHLDGLLTNLLDVTRLQAGAVPVACRVVSLADVVASAVASLSPSPGPDAVDISIPVDPGEVMTDPVLLERVVANLVENGLRHGHGPVRVLAGRVAERVELRVIDHGPGVRPELRDRMFTPFQRLGDSPNGAGIGLGLAVAQGLTEAIGGTLHAEETPGGGLTMVISLPGEAA
jgi:two-component system sensor histidine kinase KdpD